MIDKATLDAVLPLPEIEERRDELVAELKEEGFVITNFHSGGIFYTLLMIVLRIEREFKAFLRVFLNNAFVAHASGAWLDLKAAVLQQGARAVDVLVEAEMEGSRYNVPEGQITRSLTFLNGVDEITNGPDWITREGSDTEDDDGLKTRTLRSWSELAARPIEDTFINAAEGVPGVLFAQADCQHPRGQGTVDVIVTGTAGEATEGLLAEVRKAVDKIAGPYDNIQVKSSVVVPQDIEVAVTTSDVSDAEEIKGKVASILTELLAVRKGRKFNELTLSDINHAIRSGYTAATNAEIVTPAQDVKLDKDKVIILGAVSVTVRRE